MPTDRIERPKRGKNNPLSFSCTGCPVVENGEKCGETKTLDIINEFKKLYEDKMEQIDSQGAGDCTQAKLSLQQDWIRDLTEQNELLVRAVEELEQEATDRVHNLQQKLYRIESSRDKLQDDLRKLKESKASIEKEKNIEINALKENVKKAQDENNTLKKAIMEANKKLNALEDNAQQYLKERDEYKRKHQDSITALESSKKEGFVKLEELQRQKAKLENEIENVKTKNRDKWEQMKKTLLDEMAEVKKKIQEKESLLGLYEKEISKKNDENEELKKKKEELEKLTKTLETSLKNIDETKKKMRSIGLGTDKRSNIKKRVKYNYNSDSTSEPEELHNVINQLTDSVGRMMDRKPRRDLRKEITDLEEKLNKALKEKETEIENERGKRSKEVENLKSTIKELESALSQARSKVENLQKADCMCVLKEEVKILRSEKVQYENVIKFLKDEMRELSDQLSTLQELLNTSNAAAVTENAELMENIHTLEVENTNLQSQIAFMEQEIIRERNINEIHTDEVQELHKIIAEKTDELGQLTFAHNENIKKVECLMEVNEALQNAIDKIGIEIQQEHMRAEELSDDHKKEIDMCKFNVLDLQQKMKKIKEILQKKNEDYNTLKADYDAMENCMISLKDEAELMKLHYEKDINDFNHTVQKLNEKLDVANNEILKRNEELKTIQDRLLKVTETEAELKASCIEKEKDMIDNLKQLQNHEVNLIKQVTQLEQELAYVKEEMAIKNEQLRTYKQNLQKYKCGNNVQNVIAQQEISVLKDEINKMKQIKQKLEKENETLCQQICQLKLSITSYEKHNCMVSEQLDQCLMEIQSMQNEKEISDQTNLMLKNELQSLQNAFSNLSHSKTTRDELCDESRKVVNNVRAWLQEQKNLNMKLAAKVRAKNTLIRKLRHEKESLLSQVNNRLWSLESPSRSASPATTISSSAHEWCTVAEEDYFGNEPQVWVHRVESMTEELQRSNRYWQSKINDNDYVATRDE